jgi:hypothetical protein
MTNLQKRKAAFELKRAEKKKELMVGTNQKDADCPRCKNNKVDYKTYKDNKKCKLCARSFSGLWVCRADPLGHYCCQECYEC